MRQFKNLSILFALIQTMAFGQITLENTYPNAASNTQKDFGVTKLDSSTYMYYYVDYSNSMFTLYNLNHSVYQTVTIPVTYTNNIYNIQHITKSLFDCDPSNIEYALMYHDNSNFPLSINYVKIYRTNGAQIFNADSSKAVNCVGCASLYNNFIVNTPNGTKMILRHENGSVKVFGLCGILPTLITKLNTEELLSNPFPNPTNNLITIPYSLPNNEKSGTIKIYDINGKEIKSFIVDSNFTNITLTTSELVSGTYYYNLTTSKGYSDTKKIIKIE